MSDRRSNQLLEPWLDDRALALLQESDLDGIGIDTADVVSIPDEAGCRDDPDVAQPKHGNLHCCDGLADCEPG